ncbi:MAG: SAF domain-containing protein [Chloroflexota bacterium]
MLKRLMSTGVNLVVLAVSVGVFLLAFVLLNFMSAAQRPPTVKVLSAARDLSIGEVISADTLVEKTVFKDDNAALYIPAEEAEGVIGGIVAQPIFAGQPIFRTTIVAKAAEDTRLSAVLAKYPGYSLFPLPLDGMNLVAPEAASFLPGDLVGVTVVISTRPQAQSTPTAGPEMSVVVGEQPTATPAPADVTKADALARTYPPLAKDLFPAGVRVIAIQGLPVKTVTDSTNSADTGISELSQNHILMLLIPNASREELSLALQQGDKLIVSLMARGEDKPSAGFTYWDFEDLFKSDRNQSIGGGK